MDLSKHFILLNGEPKTLQIDAIQRNVTNGYSVRFKNNGRTYNYGRDKVVWLNNPEWKDPTPCKVFPFKLWSTALAPFNKRKR